MPWSEENLRVLPQKKGFRMRGMEMTRLETLIDAVFAFATTLLVISFGSIPGDYGELILALKRLPTFLASFATFMTFWLSHRKWSQRYGLTDGVSTFLSLCVTFVVLVYVYPLKLMYSALFAWMSGGWLPTEFAIRNLTELLGLFAIYGFGLTALASFMALLYVRASRAAVSLRLNPLESLETREEITTFSTVAVTGLISALSALFLPRTLAMLAGFIYILIPIEIAVISVVYGRKVKKLADE
jgi:uncharacterized membrane protein